MQQILNIDELSSPGPETSLRPCPNQVTLREGFKKKKYYGIFHIGGGGPSNLGSVSIIFFVCFKHGLNHPEIQRKFVSPLGAPPRKKKSVKND